MSLAVGLVAKEYYSAGIAQLDQRLPQWKLRSESFVRSEEGLSAWIAAIQAGRFRVTPAPYGDLEVDGDPLRLDPF